jgi:hypothetical protein
MAEHPDEREALVARGVEAVTNQTRLRGRLLAEEATRAVLDAVWPDQVPESQHKYRYMVECFVCPAFLLTDETDEMTQFGRRHSHD